MIPKIKKIVISILPGLIVAGLIFGANVYYDLDLQRVVVNQVTRIVQNLEVLTGQITGANAEQLLLGVTNDLVQVVRGGNQYIVCDSSGNCAGSFGYGFASGTVGYLAKFTATSTLSNSIVLDSGNLVSILGQLSTQATTTLATSTGLVGIGTQTPTSKLTVSGDLYVSATSTFMGNVGIGTTVPSVKLHVYESSLDKSGVLFNIATTSASYYVLNVQSGETSRLYVRADGNVGIGTTAPSSRLDIAGAGFHADLGAGNYWINYYLGTNADPNPGDIILLIPNPSGTVAFARMVGIITATRGHTASFRSTKQWHISVSRAYTDSGGSIMPLTEETAMIKLVTCDYGGTNYIAIDTSAIGAAAHTWTFTGSWANKINTQKPILISRSSCSNITDYKTYHSLGHMISISATGNVGIGTTAPSYKLSIVDSGVGLDRPAANTLAFYTAGSERMRIDSSGNVGIGTTAPGGRLDVRGLTTAATNIISYKDGVVQATEGTYHFLAQSSRNLRTYPSIYINEARNALAVIYRYVGDDGAYWDETRTLGEWTGSARTTLANTNDILYFGRSTTFTELYFDIYTAGVGYSLVWEYWNGTSWATLTVTDGTLGFSQDGWVTWSAPSDWATTTVGPDTTARYYVRVKTTANPTTVATAYYANIGGFSSYFIQGASQDRTKFFVDTYGQIVSYVSEGRTPFVGYRDEPRITALGGSGFYYGSQRNIDSAVGLFISAARTNLDNIWHYDGTTYVSRTTNREWGATPVSLLGATNHYYYFGDGSKFNELYFDISTAGAGYTLVWEYWNGTTWTTLNVTDGTKGFSKDGWVWWTAPGDWATSTVNGVTKYWIRVYTTSNPTTVATASFFNISGFSGYLARLYAHEYEKVRIDARGGIYLAGPIYPGTGVEGSSVQTTNYLAGTATGIGIGTTAPSEKLTVVGNIALSGGNRFIGTIDNYALSLRTNNTDRIYITSDGNVGIGTTAPTAKLELGDNQWMMLNALQGTAGINFFETGTKSATDVQYGAKIFYDGSSDTFRIVTRENNQDKLGISIARATGNVSIGTAWSTSKLAVMGNMNVGKYDSTTWGLSGYSYRAKIAISNSGSTLTDYQVLVTLNTQRLISDGKMRSDCGDIRFTDSDGVTLLNYWLESGCNTASTRIWVKVPSIPSGTKKIYIYYGNPSATSSSSVSDTFIPNSIYAMSGDCTDSGVCLYMDNHGDADVVRGYSANICTRYTTSIYFGSVCDNTGPNSFVRNNFYSRFRFLFLPDVSGTWYFAVDSDDGSELIKSNADMYGGIHEHSVIASWYGPHVWCNCQDHNGPISLTANQAVWLEFLHTEWDGNEAAVVWVLKPGGSWKNLNTSNYPNQIFARKYASPEPKAKLEPEQDSSQLDSILFVDSTLDNVGIGTTAPAYKLDVEGYVQAYGYYTGDIIFQTSGTEENVWRMYEDSESLYIQSIKTGQDVLSIKNTGNVGIGTTAPSNILTIVQNSATDPIADAWTTYSTPDSKIILGPADNLAFDYLEKFKKLKVYQWKRSENEPIRLGVIATEDTPSEILAYDSEGKIQGIDLGAYIGFLHEVMIAQQKQIEELKLAINENGNINYESENRNEEQGVIDNFVEKVKKALASIGLLIEEGVAKIKELVVEKLTAEYSVIKYLETERHRTKEMEFIDKATGQIYCVWIENGELKKKEGECEMTFEKEKTEDSTTTQSTTIENDLNESETIPESSSTR